MSRRARYTASVAIVGSGGWRWERSADVPIEPGRGPFSVPVLADRVALDGPPGDYRCAASLGTAAAPAAGRATVEVLRRPAALTPRRRAAALGFAEPALRWFGAHGLDIVPHADALTSIDLFLVGHASAVTNEDWHSLAAALDRGATALVLCPWELIPPGETSAKVPLGPTITCTSFHDWLYHKECFSTRADIVDGLPGPGLMTWRQYGPILPRHLLEGEADDVAAFAIAVGYPCPGGYASGLLAARFRHGRGRLVVSTFDLLSNLGELAVADCLMVNLRVFRHRCGSRHRSEQGVCRVGQR